MTFLLITLFTFATVVTVTGFFLSSKTRVHNQHASRRFIEPYSRRSAAEAGPLSRRQGGAAAPLYERSVAETASMTPRHTPRTLRSHLYGIETEFPAARSTY